MMLVREHVSIYRERLADDTATSRRDWTVGSPAAPLREADREVMVLHSI